MNRNPLAFKHSDASMQKDLAPNYIPPQKRKEIKEYLSGTTLWLPPAAASSTNSTS